MYTQFCLTFQIDNSIAWLGKSPNLLGLHSTQQQGWAWAWVRRRWNGVTGCDGCNSHRGCHLQSAHTSPHAHHVRPPRFTFFPGQLPFLPNFHYSNLAGSASQKWFAIVAGTDCGLLRRTYDHGSGLFVDTPFFHRNFSKNIDKNPSFDF